MHRSTQVSGGSDLNPLLAAGQIAIGENKNTSEGDQVQGPRGGVHTYLERDEADDDASCEEGEGLDEPDDAPH